VTVLLAEVLRNRGCTVTRVFEVGRYDKGDSGQLAYAGKHKMTIVTHNTKDYAILSKSYVELGKNHFGIIVSDQNSFS